MNKTKLLSDDARCLWTVYFGMGRPGVAQLIFGMEKSKPSARTTKGLNELVKRKIISSAPYNQFGGIVYTLQIRPGPKDRASQSLIERNDWNLVEPIEKAVK